MFKSFNLSFTLILLVVVQQVTSSQLRLQHISHGPTNFKHSKTINTQNTSSTNIVVYWGQDSAGNEYPNNKEKDLSYYCSLDNYDIINLSFMTIFIDTRQSTCTCCNNAPDLNFANHGNNCSTSNSCPYLLQCNNTIGTDILTCQKLGKKIVLSLGGSSGSYGFDSDQQAQDFANTIWSMFFINDNKTTNNNNNNICRPFGDNVILDGIDLDIEGGSTTGYSSFVSNLRKLMDSSGLNKELIISAAPQCPYPDPYMNDAITTVGDKFTYMNVQFYNNYCQISDETQFFSAWDTWNSAAKEYGFMINVGIPASEQAAPNGGYTDASVVCGYIDQLKNYSTFSGLMIWDASWDMNNNFYSSDIRSCLG